MKIYCKSCGEYFYQTPNTHLQGHGCPNCHISKGEQYAIEWLKNNNIEYIHDESISNIEGRTLNYVYPDFQFNMNGITYWIEYNGYLHYGRVPFFHDTIEDFEKQLKRDRNVREYCKENNIVLIEIPYTYNTLQKVSDFLTKVLIENIDSTTLVDYKELYELTEGISLTVDDLLLDYLKKDKD